MKSTREIVYKLPSTPASLPKRFQPLVYRSGPIIPGAQIVPLFWGEWAANEIDEMVLWLRGFIEHLAGLDQPQGVEPTIQQYGVCGASLGPWVHEPAVAANLSPPDVVPSLIKHQIASGRLPAFAAYRVFVVLTKGVDLPGVGVEWCGYHDALAPGAYYGVAAWPISDICGVGMSGLQATVSHEIMELCTDPMPRQAPAWNREDPFNLFPEGGDDCTGNAEALAFGTVQSFADNHLFTCSTWSPREGAQIALAAISASRTDIFFRGNDRTCWYSRYDTAAQQWPTFGGSTSPQVSVTAPAITLAGSGVVVAFCTATGQQLLRNTLDGDSWSGWEALTNNADTAIVGAPQAVYIHKGWQAFALGAAGDIRGWTSVEELGATTIRGFSLGHGDQIAGEFCATSKYGISTVVYAGSEGDVWYSDSSAGPNRWTNWSALPARAAVKVSCLSRPSLCRGGTQVDIVVRGTDDCVYHQYNYLDTGWTGWERIGGPTIGTPCLVDSGTLADNDNTLELFVHGFDDRLYHNTYNRSSETWNRTWDSLDVEIVGSIVGVQRGHKIDVAFEDAANGISFWTWDPGAFVPGLPPGWVPVSSNIGKVV